jgi:hypothetical protein
VIQAVNGKGTPEMVRKLKQIKDLVSENCFDIVGYAYILMAIRAMTDCTGNFKRAGDANHVSSRILVDSSTCPFLLYWFVRIFACSEKDSLSVRIF